MTIGDREEIEKVLLLAKSKEDFHIQEFKYYFNDATSKKDAEQIDNSFRFLQRAQAWADLKTKLTELLKMENQFEAEGK